MLVVVMIVFAGVGCAKPDKAQAPTVTLAFTNDGRGELTHCECEGGAAGGLARRVGYLNRLRSSERPDRIVALEAGDFLFALWPETETEKQTEKARAMLIADGYARAGYDAVLFGTRDYALGIDVAREVAAKMNTTVLGANVNDGRTGQPVWPASKIIQRAGVRIGVLGLVTAKRDGLPPGVAWPAELVVENPLAAAQRLIPALRKQCDVLVLLANLDRDELETLLKETSGVDFVVKSREAKIVTTQVDRLDRVPVLGLFELGRYVGRVDLTVVEPGKGYDDLEEQKILRRKIERYRSYVDAITQKAGGARQVEKFYAGDQATLERYRRYRESVERWERELAESKPRGNRFAYELIELDSQVPVVRELEQAVTAFETAHGTAESLRQAQFRRHPPPSPQG